MTKLFVLFMSLLALTGCDLYEYKVIYNKTCPESKDASKIVNCNGLPILLFVAQSKDQTLNSMLAKDSQAIIEQLNLTPLFDTDVQLPNSGRTPLMEAIYQQNYVAAKLFAALPMNLEIKDANGMGPLFYLSLAPSSVSRAFFKTPRQALVNAIITSQNALGQNPIHFAAINGKYDLAWQMITITGGRFDLLKISPSALPTEFFFYPRLEFSPQLFEGLSQQLSTVYTGKLKIRGRVVAVSNYSFLHFAAANQMPNLFDFLLRHGAKTDLISSEGSPLALALKSRTVNVPIWDDWETNINALLNRPAAVTLPGNLAAALKTERSEWPRRLVSAGAPLGPRDNPLFITEELVFNIGVGNDDRSGNTYAMQSLSKSLHSKLNNDEIASIREVFKSRRAESFKLNSIDQSVIDFFMYTVTPKDYQAYADNFEEVVRTAAQRNLLDRPDGLGMLPIHYWLASPARADNRNDLQEQVRLRLLMKYTKGWSAFTANRDSILGLAIQTRNLNLVKIVMSKAPLMRELMSVPNRNHLTPRDMSLDPSLKDINAYLSKY